MLAQRYAEGGDLLRALHKAGGRLTERSAVQMVVQPLLNCLVYLHSKGITHRYALPACLLLLQTLLVSGQYAAACPYAQHDSARSCGFLS